MLLGGELSAGHWVAFNAIPTAAHTIWGVLAGQWLMRAVPPKTKIAWLAGLGAAGIAGGFALTAVTPMIKRIATSSFVVATGGICLLALALSYWVVDVRKWRRGAVFFNIVGMNSLAIYLFQESGGTVWVRKLVSPFTMAFGGLDRRAPGRDPHERRRLGRALVYVLLALQEKDHHQDLKGVNHHRQYRPDRCNEESPRGSITTAVP